ncbi:lipopolysaccharide biosynthesis protein [Butyrivibrio sp. INlla14]|uniref:lipopolysaccharide biosynthesis protein n=1 Tax=Butyrivibrio sp. INlla14 TaxID=1520808 RepID=UPI0008767163|nr:hypothetical protein [Butyrivibrio sp. INlla14]SCX84381.1 Membrane protein involved in the export of O-antigen and teichoic acid [Butyrivibrio sp. INlla14]
MNVDRRTIARKSSAVGFAFQIVNILLSFATRKMFLVVLGADYLGLNSTLAQLLGALSISELGIQTVIIYRLYKPVAEDRHDEVCDIMTVFRTLYRWIALIIALGTFALLPLLKYVITNVSIPMREISIAWLMMALTSALSYLLSYNNALLYADQKQYLVTYCDLIINVAFSLLNLWMLYMYRSIYLYFCIILLRTLASNVMLLVIRKAHYRWFKFNRPPRYLVREVLADTKDMFASKIAGYVFNSTDNVVISTLIGTAVVGVVGNYITIVSSAKAIVYSIIGPIQNLAGNLLASDTENDRTGFFKNFTYITFFIESCLLIPVALSINDFVILFYGKQYELRLTVITMIIIDAYVALGQATVGCMVDASGLFKEQKRFYRIGAIINIFLSIIGAKIIGVEGVILGTIIGNIYCWYKRAYYTYKKVLYTGNEGLRRYLIYVIILTLFFFGEFAVLMKVFGILWSDSSFIIMIVKAFISLICVLVGHIIVFGRKEEFIYMVNLGRRKK